MWTCPKCGRTFKHENQSHYCGEVHTIKEYIETFDEEQRAYLSEVYDILKSVLPDTKEKISWRMPTFYKRHNLMHFAGFKKHIGLYPGADGVAAFASQCEEKGFKYSKGAIQIPYQRPLPKAFITDLAKWCLENQQ